MYPPGPISFTKIVAWDFDGTMAEADFDITSKIASTNVISLQTMQAQEITKNNRAYCLLDNVNITPNTRYHYVNEPNYWYITFQLLHEAGVLSFSGSQRVLLRNPLDPNHKLYQEHHAFLEVFFKNWPEFSILPKDISQSSAPIMNISDANKPGAKNIILNDYRNKFKTHVQNITLIDDKIDYKIPTEAAGYNFIHAKEDLSHLFEVALQLIGFQQINQRIDSTIKYLAYESQDQNSFLYDAHCYKRDLITYYFCNRARFR